MNITITTGFSKGRIESFYKFHYKKISNVRFYELIFIIVLLAISLFCIFMQYVTLAIIGIVIALVVTLTYPYRIYVAVKKMLKKTPMNSKTYKITLTDEKITYVVDDKVSCFNWIDVIRFCEIDMCYYIYIGPSTALVIPKYTLKQIQKEELVKFAKEITNYKKYRFYSADELEGVV